MGIWLCYNDWPIDQTNKDFTIALEPCTANTDSLSDAIGRNISSKINPRQTNKWSITLEVKKENKDKLLNARP